MSTQPRSRAMYISHLTPMLWNASFPKENILVPLDHGFLLCSRTQAGTKWVLHRTH